MFFIIMFFLGVFLALVSSIWGLILAFQTDIVWGLIAFFVPFGMLVFTIVKWQNRLVRKAFFVGLASWFLMIPSLLNLMSSIYSQGKLISNFNSSRFPLSTTKSDSSSSLSLTKPEHFRNGVNTATKAAQLTQTAKKSQEWKQVSLTWQKAINSMKSVPNTSPNYKLAQGKVKEYQKNLRYAQNNAKNAGK